MFIWTIGDVIGLLILSFTVGFYLYHIITRNVKQKLCKHERKYKKTSGRLDTICKDCGKNFGFES